MLRSLINEYESMMIQDLQKFIRIDSIENERKADMPFGQKVNDALKFVLNKGKEFGFKTKNINGYAGYVEIGSGEHLIGILVHVDVVPSGSGWVYPPFGGVIVDNKIYGRGAIDNKGPIISSLYSMKVLLENNMLKEGNRIRLIIGTAEETSWEGIRYYVNNEEIPNVSFTPDANFPVIHGEKGLLDFDLNMHFKNKNNENDGISILSIDGGDSRNMVPSKSMARLFVPQKEIKEFLNKIDEYNSKYTAKIKAIFDSDFVKLLIDGKAAHGSTPEKGINSISYMILFLNSLSTDDGDKTKFLEYYSRLIGIEYDGMSLNCNFHDVLSGNLTLNVGTIKLKDNNVKLECNLRYPISVNYNKIKNIINLKLKDTSFEYFEYEHLKPIFFSKNDSIVKKLMDVYKEVTQDNEAKPIVIGGATYARALPNTLAFGPVFPKQKELAHEPNEYIKIEHLKTITEIYGKAIIALCK